MEKIVTYKCKKCSMDKEKKEFHYEQFESLNPKKMCWECEKEEYGDRLCKIAEMGFKDREEYIKQLESKISKLERINSIKIPAPKESITKHKHHSLNIWMEEGNTNQAWLLHKGQMRLYRTFPNQYKENDSVIVYKRPDGSNKYYGLTQMHEWIMEEKNVEVF